MRKIIVLRQFGFLLIGAVKMMLVRGERNHGSGGGTWNPGPIGGGGGSGTGGTGGGLGGGWVPIDETFEEVYASLLGHATSEIESIGTTSDDGTTRDKYYGWTIYSQDWGWYKFVSHEKGVHKKAGNEWRWQSLTHVDITRVETMVGGSVTCDLIQAIPTVGIYNAGMAINYHIEASALWRGSPLSRGGDFLSQRYFNVND